jgi:hypothetical protein
MQNTAQLSFSGHETFVCKQFWLKKGYDFVSKGKKFSDSRAVVDLGVGKNMVGAINFWLKAFGMTEQNALTEIAHYLFGEKGKDIYLEDIGTIWLLHYFLIKTERASIYSLFFNEFLKEKPEFNKERLRTWLVNRTESKFSENTIDRDIDVLLRTYLKPKNSKSIEKDFINIFVGLGLLVEKDKKMSVVIDEKPHVPAPIFLYAILDNPDFANTNSISLKDLRFAKNSVGLVFGMTNEGIYQKIKELEQQYPEAIIFTETAGNPVLQFKEKLDKTKILNEYYQ